MPIHLRTTASLRTRLALALGLALFALPCVARADGSDAPAGAHAHHAGQKRPRKAKAADPAVTACVHERTGPTGGIPAKEALKLCTQIARHTTKHAKAKARAAKAIEACRDDVFVACEDETERDHDDGECSDEALQAELAECVATEVK